MSDDATLDCVRRWLHARMAYVAGASESDETLGALSVSEASAAWDLERTPLQTLTGRLGLGSVDRLVLGVLAAVDGDPIFEGQRRLWVNDDPYMTVDLLLRLCSGAPVEQDRILGRLDARRPLVRRGLVTLNRPSERPGTTLRNYLIELDESVVAYLAGRDYWPCELSDVAELEASSPPVGRGFFAPKLARLDRIVAWPGESHGRCVAICGSTQETTRALALAWASAHQRPLIAVSGERLAEHVSEAERLLRIAIREALLRRAVLFVDGVGRSEGIGQRSVEAVVRRIARSARDCSTPILLDAPLDGHEALRRNMPSLFEVPVLPPTLEEQVVLWRESIERVGLRPLPDAVLETKVCDMALNPEDVHRTVRLAVRQAYLSTDGGRPDRVTPDTLRAIATSKLNQGMYAVAERVNTSLTWNDVILPPRVLAQLMDIVSYARYQRQVYEEWGFGRKMPYGRANSSLFSGPPGTGKTMVAGIIAHELGMDLFRVETSQVVSKYIGETEKNLAKVFDEAKRSHAILLFDEADSLFAKRTEVKSSNDRYANLEVNYLLQRIESFDGISIMTTNFRDNIDEAFQRRLKFKVEFPVPNAHDRSRLWQIMIPKQVELAERIDFDWLGRTFAFTGANIKEAVLRAAFRAAEADRTLDTELLEQAGITVAKEMGSLLRVVNGRVVPSDAPALSTFARGRHAAAASH